MECAISVSGISACQKSGCEAAVGIRMAQRQFNIRLRMVSEDYRKYDGDCHNINVFCNRLNLFRERLC